MSAFPNTSHEPNTAEVLRKFTSFGFSLLSPNDQQDKIEQISKELAAGVADVERLEGETEEDLRRKTFAELLNKAPVDTIFYLFREFTYEFNNEETLCEAILLFKQLDSNEQQKEIEKMFRQLSYLGSEELKDVILERLPEECEEAYRLRRFIKLCRTYYGLMLNFISNEAKKWDLESLLMQASGNEEIEEIKQSRYAEYYLGLSIIWFKARWASDPKSLIHLIISTFGEGDHIVEKLVIETEEDFRLRKFTESFKQLPFSFQRKIVNRVEDIIINDLGIPVLQQRTTRETDEEFALGFRKLKTPNPGGGAAATQGGGQGAITQGGGQGAITQGGQGPSQQ